MYSHFSKSISRVLNNILDSIPKKFTSAQFINAVSYYCSEEYQRILSNSNFRSLHSWIARWYLNGNPTIKKIGKKSTQTINGNKSTNVLWKNTRKY